MELAATMENVATAFGTRTESVEDWDVMRAIKNPPERNSGGQRKVDVVWGVSRQKLSVPVR
jgi:hypothetical protein